MLPCIWHMELGPCCPPVSPRGQGREVWLCANAPRAPQPDCAHPRQIHEGTNVGIVLASQSLQQNSLTWRQLASGLGFGAELSCSRRENAAPFSLGGAQILLCQHRAGSCHSPATVWLAGASLQCPPGDLLSPRGFLDASQPLRVVPWVGALPGTRGQETRTLWHPADHPHPLREPLLCQHLLLAPSLWHLSGQSGQETSAGGRKREGKHLSFACSIWAHSRLVLGCQAKPPEKLPFAGGRIEIQDVAVGLQSAVSQSETRQLRRRSVLNKRSLSYRDVWLLSSHRGDHVRG